MRLTVFSNVCMLLSFLLISACVNSRVSLPKDILDEAQVSSFENSFVRLWGDADKTEIDLAQVQNTPTLKVTTNKVTGEHHQDFLVLSGGGAKGAYGAGLLNGWSQTGTRPEFSIVTGVSTGAIIAPFAYLGSDYDPFLEEFYTSYSTKDLVRNKGLGGILGGSSAADSKPLAKLIAKYITMDVMAEIAMEYETGRYLLVGTTNLDSQRPVIWNMGEIARRGNQQALDLFRAVILASISIPGAFPPVLIDVNASGSSGQELHVDGGTTDNAILVPVHVNIKDVESRFARNARKRVFVVVNSNLSPKPTIVKASTLHIAVRSINTLIQQQTTGDILKLYSYSRANDIEFNYTEIPDSFDEDPKELFDPVYMKSLFQLGFEEAKNGKDWSKLPSRF